MLSLEHHHYHTTPNAIKADIRTNSPAKTNQKKKNRHNLLIGIQLIIAWYPMMSPGVLNILQVCFYWKRNNL